MIRLCKHEQFDVCSVLTGMHATGRARHCFECHPLTELLESLWDAVVSVEHEVDHNPGLGGGSKRSGVKGGQKV